MGDGEKLLTHLNSALKVLLGLDIFPRVPKKKVNFVDQCYGRNKLCLVSCLGSEPRLAQSQTAGLQLFRHLGEAAAPGEGECGPCPDFASYTLAFAL